MSAARERILGNIRAALGREAGDEAGLRAARERIAAHPRQIEPAFDEALAERFCAKLEAAHATVARLESVAAAGAEIERYLDAAGAGQRLLASGDSVVGEIGWPPSLEVQQRAAGGDDRVSVTSALCGIAETGTLMLVSGEGNPTSLNFLPDYHVVVLRAQQLVARMEDAWDRLRADYSQPPRTVNFISGPSKTADVEQTVEYGAHGPRCLHVILLG